MEGLIIAGIFLCLVVFGAVKDRNYERKVENVRSSIQTHKKEARIHKEKNA